MSTSRKVILLAVLGTVFVALWGCSPCKDWKAIVANRNVTIDSLLAQVSQRDTTIAEAKRLEASLRESIEQCKTEKQVLVDRLNEKVSVTIPDQLLFGSGQVMILDTMVPTLQAIRDACNEYPDWDVYVEGYTDNQKLWPDFQEVWPTNWELGAARAAAVTRYLTNELEMSAKRFAVVSYGPFRPVADNSTPEGRKANRFVRIVLHRTTPR